MKMSKRRINKATGLEYQKGDSPSDEDLPRRLGKTFWLYRDNKILQRGTLKGYCKEEWVTQEQISKYASATRERVSRPGIREKNPATGRDWRRGEVCEKRGIFWEYTRETNNDGFKVSVFFDSYEKYHTERIKTIFMKRRIFAKRKGIAFDVDANYFIEIFPADGICPVLGIKLDWTQKKNSPENPSIDRIMPAVGYTRGNLAWISYRANMIKGDATIEEIKCVIDYMQEKNVGN